MGEPHEIAWILGLSVLHKLGWNEFAYLLKLRWRLLLVYITLLRLLCCREKNDDWMGLVNGPFQQIDKTKLKFQSKTSASHYARP